MSVASVLFRCAFPCLDRARSRRRGCAAEGTPIFSVASGHAVASARFHRRSAPSALPSGFPITIGRSDASTTKALQADATCRPGSGTVPERARTISLRAYRDGRISAPGGGGDFGSAQPVRSDRLRRSSATAGNFRGWQLPWPGGARSCWVPDVGPAVARVACGGGAALGVGRRCVRGGSAWRGRGMWRGRRSWRSSCCRGLVGVACAALAADTASVQSSPWSPARALQPSRCTTLETGRGLTAGLRSLSDVLLFTDVRVSGRGLCRERIAYAATERILLRRTFVSRVSGRFSGMGLPLRYQVGRLMPSTFHGLGLLSGAGSSSSAAAGATPRRARGPSACGARRA